MQDFDRRGNGEFVKAIDGDSSAFATLLEQFRPLLLKIANAAIDPELRVKVAPSDLVQSTLLCACVGFSRANFQSFQDVQAWLKGILELELKESNRHYRQAKKRDIGREQPLDGVGSREGLREISLRLSASGTSELERREHVQLLLAAMDGLPAHYREIIRWHHFDEMPFVQVASMLNENVDAVRMLFNRAIHRLKRELHLRQGPEKKNEPTHESRTEYEPPQYEGQHDARR